MGKNTTIKNVTISKASEVLVNLNAKSAQKVETLPEKFNLSEFQSIENESASKAERTALPVEFSDLINTPFRTITRNESTTIQVSFNWLKQHDREPIVKAFNTFCKNGHIVSEVIQKAFDATFKRPSFLYTCKCGITFEKSYVMRKEASQYKCKCGALVSTMTVTRN